MEDSSTVKAIGFVGLICAAVMAVTIGCTPQTSEGAARRQERIEKEAADQAVYNASRSRFIAEVDGCRVWEVYNNQGTNPFLARCPEGAGNTFEKHRVSKHSEINNMTLGGN